MRLISGLTLLALLRLVPVAGSSRAEAQQITLIRHWSLSKSPSDSGGFARIGPMVAMPGGGIAFLDAGRNQLVILDSTGRVNCAASGEKGSTWFRLPTSIGLLADTVWISDAGSSQVSFFTRDCKRRRTDRAQFVAASGDSVTAPVLGMFPGGLALVRPAISPSDLLQLSPDDRVPFFRVRLTTRETKEVGALRLGHSAIALSTHAVLRYQPFDDGDLLRIHPAGAGMVVIERTAPTRGDRNHYSIRWLDSTLMLRNELRLPYSPIRLPHGAADSVTRAALTLAKEKSRAIESGMEGMIRSSLFLPAFLPPVSDAIVDAADAIWIRREDQGDNLARWDVVRRDGTVVGTAVLPAAASIRAAKFPLVWIVDTGRSSNGSQSTISEFSLNIRQ